MISLELRGHLSMEQSAWICRLAWTGILGPFQFQRCSMHYSPLDGKGQKKQQPGPQGRMSFTEVLTSQGL